MKSIVKVFTLLLAVFCCGQTSSSDSLPLVILKAHIAEIDAKVSGGTTAENTAYSEYVKQLFRNWKRFQIAERPSEADIRILIRLSRFDTREKITEDTGDIIPNILPITVIYIYDSGLKRDAPPVWGAVYRGKYFWEDPSAGPIQLLHLSISAQENKNH